MLTIDSKILDDRDGIPEHVAAVFHHLMCELEHNATLADLPVSAEAVTDPIRTRFTIWIEDSTPTRRVIICSVTMDDGAEPVAVYCPYSSNTFDISDPGSIDAIYGCVVTNIVNYFEKYE